MVGEVVVVLVSVILPGPQFSRLSKILLGHYLAAVAAFMQGNLFCNTDL